MSSLAILLLVRATTHSYAAAGAAVGAYALASAVMAPVQGRLVDRFGRVRVLAPLREVLDGPGVRETACALEAVTQELVWITGPLLVALVITVTSPSAAIVLLAIVCVGGTMLFVRSPLARDRQDRVAAHQRTSVMANSRLLALLGPIVLTGLNLGAVEVGLPSLALHAGSRSASGILLALWSVGSMTGGLWYGSRAWRSSLAGRYRMLLLVAAVFTAPLILARSIPLGIVCSLLAGLTIAPVFSCQYALVGRAVTAGSETEAFTWVTAALVAGIAAGSAVGGAAIASSGVGAPFVIACVATALAALLALGLRGRVEQPA